MQSYLIPYVDPIRNDGEEDPLFSEFTYGDSNQRGWMLSNKVEKGDYLFFHLKIRGIRHLTAYYYVEKVISVAEAKVNPLIKDKYKNPHLDRNENRDNEVLVFGHPIYSKVLSNPLPLNDEVLSNLSKRPKSVARPWVKLDRHDIDFLIKKIKEHEDLLTL